MFLRSYKVVLYRLRNGRVAYVPSYRNWYSISHRSLLEKKNDYCTTYGEALEICIKYIICDSIYRVFGEVVDVNEVEKHKDYVWARNVVEEQIKIQKARP